MEFKDCLYCGQKHAMRKLDCPAWGKQCKNCGKRNHFQTKCKNSKVRVNAVEDQLEDQEDSWLYHVGTARSSPKTRMTAKMGVDGTNINFQLDSGADVNTICRRFVKREQLLPSRKRLVMWNGTKVIPVGETKLTVTNLRTNQQQEVAFVVVPNHLVCLLGLETMKDMHLITVHEDRFIAQIGTQSEPLGDLGEVHLKVNPDMKPRALPCRTIPVALRDTVKAELDRLVQKGVLVPVGDPTEWVSQMAVVSKGNGKMRICIDPQPLNEALLREHYKLPTVDEVLPMLHGAKFFSKVDVKEAFWHVRLDEQSSELTTMITPFGRYRWARLPFGLKVSSEIFQRKLTEALSGLDGTFTIADDIIIAGCGDSFEEASKDNKAKLSALRERCKERRIILNAEKMEVQKSQIRFHGHLFTDKGVKVDPSKIEAILEMPAPGDVPAVKRLCGMVQYMSRFLPNLAQELEPLHALTRKEADWHWSEACERALGTIKTKLTEAPVLSYFNVNKDVVLQVDSSKDGLGAVLLQDGRPVEYASRTLTPAERNWAQIEKELLAVVYGLERFDQYTYGMKVTVQNAHKPLSAILKKPLSQCPKRLQTLLMRVHRYDVEFRFIKGSKLIVADTLSRAYIDSKEDVSKVLNIKWFHNIPDVRLHEIQQATMKDASLQQLKDYILEGWPTHKERVPPDIRRYFDLRHVLSFHEGIILKGEAILIPHSVKSDMLRRLHSAHLGYDSMIRRARGLIFWLDMARDIHQIAVSCEPCQQLKPGNPRETLQPQSDGTYPWEKIACDLFEIKGQNYMVCIDCFSNFIEVDHLPTITSSRVITIMKKLFARYGIPKVLLTDAGVQFTSRDFQVFLQTWGVHHVQSSPGHHSANGKAEAAVKVAKHLLIKAGREGADPNIALLEQRNTPRQDTGLSPVQMAFGRQTRTMIPCLKPVEPHPTADRRRKRKQTVKRYHDRHAHDLPQLKGGQHVFF